MVVMGVLGVAGSEGELAEEDVILRLRERVFVQFGACGCAWCDDEELGGDGTLLLGAASSRSLLRAIISFGRGVRAYDTWRMSRGLGTDTVCCLPSAARCLHRRVDLRTPLGGALRVRSTQRLRPSAGIGSIALDHNEQDVLTNGGA